MGAHETKTFMSGNSVAVRLPRALGIGPDERVEIEQKGNSFTLRRVVDPAIEKQRLLDMLVRLQAIGAPPDGVQDRDPFEFPDRPKL